MVLAYEVCVLLASKKLGSPRTYHLLEKHQVVLLCAHIYTHASVYTGSATWCIPGAYYRHVPQPQARRRTCKKNAVNWLPLFSGCMQGESDNLRIVRVTQCAQQSLLWTDCFSAAMVGIAERLRLSFLQMHRASKTISEVGCVGAPLLRNTSLGFPLFTHNNAACCLYQ